MKQFEDVVFDVDLCRQQLAALKKLLTRNELSERTDIQKFLKKRKQLTAFLGAFAPRIGPAAQIAYEYSLVGDFAADIVVGNRERGEFCLIELEDGRRNSIFRKLGTRSTRHWTPRFEHGFSQLVDWFFCLDDFKKTSRFARDFGHGHIKFFGLLIIGRNDGLSDYERERLRWRTEKIRVDSHNVDCITFDELHDFLRKRLDDYYPEARESEAAETNG